ncbi:MAG: B12-binding domain-containing protein [Bacteriovoracaceae bacterium]
MFRWCSFCQSYIGQKEPYQDYSITHGICLKCKNNIEDINLEKFEKIISFYQELKETLDLGVLPECKFLVQKGRQLNITPADLLAGIMQPLLYEIGARYEKGKLEIYQEHQFSNFTQQLIHELIKEYKLDFENSASPEVLLFMAEHEYHEFGVRFLEVLFRQEGLKAKAILPGMPTDQILKLSQRFMPKVICISVTIEKHFEDLLNSLTVFNNWQGELPLIIVGGQGANHKITPSLDYIKINTGDIQSILKTIKERVHSQEKKVS